MTDRTPLSDDQVRWRATDADCRRVQESAALIESGSWESTRSPDSDLMDAAGTICDIVADLRYAKAELIEARTQLAQRDAELAAERARAVRYAKALRKIVSDDMDNEVHGPGCACPETAERALAAEVTPEEETT